MAPRGSAALERPRYAEGDYWTYATNLTEAFGLRFVGNTTAQAGRTAPVDVEGTSVNALEVLASGGGTFAATVEGFGSIAGTWTVTGTEFWEAEGWKAVRSFARIVAEGEIPGTPPVAVHFELANDTARVITEDTWRWPIAAGATGATVERWNVTQNLTVQFSGFPPQWNESAVEGTFVTTFAHLRTEQVTVPAGTFDADVIREVRPEGVVRMRWFAPRVGNDVRVEGYNETGDRVTTSELVAYRYVAGVPPPPFPWIPVVLGALAVAAVALGALLVRRRRQKPVEVWEPPEPPASP